MDKLKKKHFFQLRNKAYNFGGSWNIEVVLLSRRLAQKFHIRREKKVKYRDISLITVVKNKITLQKYGSLANARHKNGYCIIFSQKS